MVVELMSLFDIQLFVCRFFHCLQALVNCGLSGPTSPLAFGEAVLGAIRRSAGTIQNKELLWKMWSLVVSSLTETITQVLDLSIIY